MALFGRSTEADTQRAEAYRRWLRQRNPYAIASVVLGIISLIEGGVLVVFGVAAVACGVVALRQLATARGAATGAEAPYGRPLAWVGIVLGVVSLAVAAVLYGLSWR